MALASAPSTPKGRATLGRLLGCARNVAIANDGHLEVAWVAEEAGVVPSLVNRYFGSRAGLVSALIDDFFERLRADVARSRSRRCRGRGHSTSGSGWKEVCAFTTPILSLSSSTQACPANPRWPRPRTGTSTWSSSMPRRTSGGVRPVASSRRPSMPELAGAAMFGAMQRVMVAALSRKRRPRPERVVEILWRQVAAAVEIDP